MLLETFLSVLLRSGHLNIPPKDLECLALNAYHETRSESELGKIAVTHVVMNRVKSEKYPNNVCDVIKKATYKAGAPKTCHFSWYCDGKSDKPTNIKAWREAVTAVRKAYVIYNLGVDISSGAVMYHATYVSPYWKKAYKRITRIDSHIFYSEK